MLRIFKPSIVINRIDDMDLNKFISMGIIGLVIDIDNTITKHDQMFCEEWAIEFITQAKKKGMKICLVSNNNKRRVEPISSQLKVDALADAGKPLKKAYNKALGILGLKPNQAAAVGDQLFTDVLGGNRSGLYTVLVDPIDKNEALRIRVIRPIEYALKVFIR